MWRMLAILLIILATLDVLQNAKLADGVQAFFVMHDLFFVMSLLLLAVVWLGFWLARSYPKWALLIKSLSFLGVLSLFIMRTVAVYADFEKHTPDGRHWVRATASIEQISDSVFDEQAGSWRQLVILHNVHSPTLQSHRTLTASNPLYVANLPNSTNTNHDLSSDKFAKFNGMQVLISAKPNDYLDDHTVKKLNNLRAGDTVELDLMIQPISAKRSASGFDGYRWLRTRGVHAKAEVMAVGQIVPMAEQGLLIRLQQARHAFRVYFYQDWQNLDGQTQQAKAVMLSLLTGDRALIDTSTKALYQLAGISHLLAISGTHVLFLAMILSGLAVWICNTINANIYQTLPKWQIRMAVMVLASLLYALFTGFEVPAARTVYMLIAMWVVRSLVLPIGQFVALALVAMLMVWFDPYVLWQAGFWLSFVAVLLLMSYQGEQNVATNGMIWHAKKMIKLQFWLFVAMLPITILLFGKVSIWGVLVNLVAIGLFGMVIVPINLLAGALYFILPSISAILWAVGERILFLTHWLLDFLLPVHLGEWGVWLYLPVGMAGFALCLCVVVWLILPRILPKSVLILPAMALLFMLNTNSFAKESVIYPIKSDRKNISQHLLIHQAKTGRSAWLILADYGAKNYSQNDVQTTIEQLKRQGVYQIDGVIVQTPSERFVPLITALHEQFSIQQYWQAGKNQSVLAYQQPCEAGKNWQADGLSIRALTGWRQIDDEKVWACSLEIISDTPMQIVRDGVAENLSNADTVQMLFDASVANDDWAWQIWQMLCQSNQGDLDFRTIDGAYRLWFGFEQNESVAVEKFSPDEQLFLR